MSRIYASFFKSAFLEKDSPCSRCIWSGHFLHSAAFPATRRRTGHRRVRVGARAARLPAALHAQAWLVATAALALGYVGDSEPAAQADGVLAILMAAGEPLRHTGAYDFGASDLFRRMLAQARSMAAGIREAGHSLLDTPRFADALARCEIDARALDAGGAGFAL